jgi:hypothetical protein
MFANGAANLLCPFPTLRCIAELKKCVDHRWIRPEEEKICESGAVLRRVGAANTGLFR